MKWISIHIFYYENPGFLIIKLLPDIFCEIKERKFSSLFFYIRYNENGPHVRLRIKCESAQFNDFKDYCNKEINAFLNKYPSKSKISIDSWFPNNSFQYIDYIPETERYGGITAISFAEEQFMHSSNTIISYLQKGHSNYINNVYNAIDMHLVLSYVMIGNKITDLILFFSYISSGKHLHLYGEGGMNLHFLENNKYVYNRIIKTYNDLVNSSLNNNILLEWYNNLLGLYAKLQTDSFFSQDLKSKSSNDKIRLWSVYLSYIHMSNNRFGIKNADEQCMYKIINNSLIYYMNAR